MRRNLVRGLHSRSHPIIETKLPPVFLSIPLRRVKCVFHKVNPSELMAWTWQCRLIMSGVPNKLVARTRTHENGHTRRSLLHRFRWSRHRKGVHPTVKISHQLHVSHLGPARPPTHQGSNATALLTGNLSNPLGGEEDNKCNNVPPPKLCPTRETSSVLTRPRHESNQAELGSDEPVRVAGGGPSSVYK
jgi:hypothetical protein